MIRILCLISLLLTTAGILAADAPAPRRLITESIAIRAPVGPLAIGINSHLATRYPDAATMPVPAAIVADLGVQWVREDLHWHRIQPHPDTWDWVFTDAALYALRRQRLQILGVLGPAVGWATADPNDRDDLISFAPPDETAFVAYVSAVVQRYKHLVKHWQIWNEPDQALFWRPTPDPERYTRLLIKTARAIRAIDPTATIVLGGINPFDTGFLRAIAAFGGWHAFDVIAIHPYVDPLSPEEGNLIAAADGVRAIAAHYGPKPIWATEIGWASGPGDRDALGLTTAAQQADYLARAYRALWQGGVSHVFWYTLKDDPHNPYGLFAYGRGRADFSIPKPIAAAMRNLASTLARSVTLSPPVVVQLHSQSAQWQRPAQPNGSLRVLPSGILQASYRFTTRANDYVAFELREAIPLPAETTALAIHLLGDGNGHRFRVWLRDSEGEIYSLTAGVIGPPTWQTLTTPISRRPAQYTRIAGDGNGRPDWPLALHALVIDDDDDAWSGMGEVYIGQLEALIAETDSMPLEPLRDGERLPTRAGTSNQADQARATSPLPGHCCTYALPALPTATKLSHRQLPLATPSEHLRLLAGRLARAWPALVGHALRSMPAATAATHQQELATSLTDRQRAAAGALPSRQPIAPRHI
ncbi:glycosyl hydrolase [Chloroflexus sp.]|uniref:glycosyl hydrolase n=1 Tax=Chloroflexus sp. TaxID=1904827 RepID=UPI002629DEB6|nr:glycosyl hydrolase [uncultured Chloroflexus sp.]